MNITPHFSAKELECPCCHVATMDTIFMDKLEKLRVAYGSPITINSGFRCPKHNKDVGGAPASYHMQGKAADIAVPNKTARYKLVKLALEIGFGGIEISSVHLHVDNRPGDPVMIILDRAWTQL